MHCQILADSHGQDFHLCLAFHEAVHRLQDLDPRGAQRRGAGLGLHHLPGGEVRHPQHLEGAFSVQLAHQAQRRIQKVIAPDSGGR